MADMPTFVYEVTNVTDCKYHISFTFTKGDKDILSGNITFRMPPGFGKAYNISPANVEDGTPRLYEVRSDDFLLQQWSLTSLTEESITYSFDTDYTGESDLDIIEALTYRVRYTGGGGTGKVEPPLRFEKTIASCTAPEPVVNPTLQVNIIPSADLKCHYDYTFTMKKGTNDIDYYTLSFTLPKGFGEPEDINPPNNTIESNMPQFDKVMEVSGESTYLWSLQGIEGDNDTFTSSFHVPYTGDVGTALLMGDKVTWKTVFTDGEQKTGTLEYVGTTKEKCPNMPPTDTACCEACDDTILQTVTFEPCDDYKEVNYEEGIAVEPRGRKISVNLNLPAVCDAKDVVVGVYLNEVIDGKEYPYAHKVIKRLAAVEPTGDCVDDRDCNCVDFFVYDEEVCANTRTFKVRTKAHQLDTNLSEIQQCTCDCNG